MSKFRKIFNLAVVLLVPLLVILTVADVLEVRHKTDFNLDNIKGHIEELAKAPHSLYDDEGNELAYQYIKDELASMGLVNEDTTLRPSYLTQEVLVEQINSGSRDLYTGLYGDASKLGDVTIYNEPYEINNVIASIPANSANRSGKAIMIMAHFDSVPMGPGASDDSVAIGVMLEAIRYYMEEMKNGFTMDNDLVFVFTDGEEFGLYGAAAFMGEIEGVEAFKGFDGLLSRIKFAVNLESRGTSGTLIMFETSPNNFNTVRLFAKINRNIFTSSIANLVYQQMPNGTDFSNYNQVYQGLNFANLGAGYNYHTQNDKRSNVGSTYLTQQAILVDDIIEKTAHFDLQGLYGAEGDAVFFSYLNIGTVYYTKLAANVLGVLAIVLLVALVASSIIRKTNRFTGTLKGHLVIYLSIITSAIAALLLYYLFSYVAAFFGVIDVHAIGSVGYSHITIVLSIILLSFGMTAAVCFILGKILRVTGKDVRKAVTYFVAFLGIVLSFVLPEASYLFVIPGILLLVMELLGIFVKKIDTASLYLSLLVFGIAFSLVYPAISLATDALGLGMCYAFAGLSAILGLMFIPVHLEDFRHFTLAAIRLRLFKKTANPQPINGITNVLVLTLVSMLIISLSKGNISVNYQGKQSIPYLPYDDALVYVINGESRQYLVKDLDAFTYIRKDLEGYTFNELHQAYVKDSTGEPDLEGLSVLRLEGKVLTIDRSTASGYVDLAITNNANLESVTVNYGTYTKTYDLAAEQFKNVTIRIRHDATVTFTTTDDEPVDADIIAVELLINYELLKTFGDFEKVTKVEQAKFNIIRVTELN